MAQGVRRAAARAGGDSGSAKKEPRDKPAAALTALREIAMRIKVEIDPMVVETSEIELAQQGQAAHFPIQGENRGGCGNDRASRWQQRHAYDS